MITLIANIHRHGRHPLNRHRHVFVIVVAKPDGGVVAAGDAAAVAGARAEGDWVGPSADEGVDAGDGGGLVALVARGDVAQGGAFVDGGFAVGEGGEDEGRRSGRRVVGSCMVDLGMLLVVRN